MALNFGRNSKQVAIEPSSAFPLDTRSYFESKVDADNAVKTAREAGSTDTIYYYGQTLCVYENNEATLYMIQPPDATHTTPYLELIGTQADWAATSGVAKILNKPNMEPGTKLNGDIDNSSIILAGGTILNGATSAATMRNSAVIGPGCIAGGRLFLIESFARVEDDQVLTEVSNVIAYNSENNVTVVVTEVEEDGKLVWKDGSGNKKNPDYFTFTLNNTPCGTSSSSVSTGFKKTPFNAFVVRQVGDKGKNDKDTVTILYKLLGFGADSKAGAEREKGYQYTAQFIGFGNAWSTFNNLQTSAQKEGKSLEISYQKTGHSPYNGTIAEIRTLKSTDSDQKYIVVLNKFFTMADADGRLLYELGKKQHGFNTNLYKAGVSFWIPSAYNVGTTEMNIFEENPFNVTSLAIGVNSIARTPGAIALGNNCLANGRSSFAIGNSAQTQGQLAFAFGQSPKALAEYAIAIGQTPSATSTGAIAIGRFTKATGSHAIALGGGDSTKETKASGSSSVAVGQACEATGTGAIAMGKGSKAINEGAVALGVENIANKAYSFALGHQSEANGMYSFAFGDSTKTSGLHSFAFGKNTIASNEYEVAFGKYNAYVKTSNGVTGTAFTIGNGTATRSNNLFAIYENGDTIITGDLTYKNQPAIVPGSGTNALILGNYPGKTENGITYESIASGAYAISAGAACEAAGNYSIAGGIASHTIGDYSFAMGVGTIAQGETSVALGAYSQAMRQGGMAFGLGVVAVDQGEFVTGRYNYHDEVIHRRFVVGDGQDATNRSNAFEIWRDTGDAYLKGTLYIGGTGLNFENAQAVATETQIQALAKAIESLGGIVVFE